MERRVRKIKMSKWISVKDRLPSNARAVLVYLRHENGLGTYCIANCNVEEEWRDWITEIDLEEFEYTVVAWQELPDEYRGE